MLGRGSRHQTILSLWEKFLYLVLKEYNWVRMVEEAPSCLGPAARHWNYAFSIHSRLLHLAESRPHQSSVTWCPWLPHSIFHILPKNHSIKWRHHLPSSSQTSRKITQPDKKQRNYPPIQSPQNVSTLSKALYFFLLACFESQVCLGLRDKCLGIKNHFRKTAINQPVIIRIKS